MLFIILRDAQNDGQRFFFFSQQSKSQRLITYNDKKKKNTPNVQHFCLTNQKWEKIDWIDESIIRIVGINFLSIDQPIS